MSEPIPCPDEARLKTLIDGTMPAVEQADLTRHLDGCPRCQQTIERLSASGQSWADVARQLREGPPAGEMEPGLQRAVDQLAGETTADSADDDEKLDFLLPPAKPGQLGRLGHYEVLELVGKGGMGVVLRAFDEKLHRVVAIKVMASALAASGTARKRFVREAQAAAAVAHEHVVTIHAVEEEHRPPYLVMQYVDGMSLQDKLDRAGPLGLKEVLRIGLQIAHGLAAAHQQGLVHRDIKPANILLENGVERVKITDFGLARAVDDASLTQSGVIAGTPMYMSPEQAAGESIDHRSDLFSLGSVLYAMCTGRPPFRASGTHAVIKRVIDDTPRPIPEVNQEIPGWLCDLIARLHAKNPADRFQSAQEVADLLGQHLAHLQQPSNVAMPKAMENPPSAEPVRKRRWAGMVSACVLLLGLSGGLFLAHQAGWLSWSSDPSPPQQPNPKPVVVQKGSDGEGWVQLFNGKDLTGWASSEGGNTNWKVVDGAITCSGPQHYLYTKREDYGDFHLRAEVKINAAGNSGIYFRTGQPLMVVGDYEAQITNHPGQAQKTGSLFGLARVKEPPVPPDTWFTYEIIVRGKQIRLLVNGKETAHFTETRPDRPAKGHIALQHHDNLTQVLYRKIEIKELSPSKSVEPAAPFVILAKDARAERTFTTLAEAVATAQSGDTIEIRGDGLFLTEPIRIKGRALTLRAAAGFRPVLRLSPEAAEGEDPLFKTDAPLVLEGLDLQRVGGRPWEKTSPIRRVLYSWRAPLNAVNCRFVLNRQGGPQHGLHCIAADGSPWCELHNCQFLHRDGSFLRLDDRRPAGRCVVKNCLIACSYNILLDCDGTGRGGLSVELTGNTFVKHSPVSVNLFERPALAQEPAVRPVRITASANIWNGSFSFNQAGEMLAREASLSAKEAEELLVRLIEWRDRQNLYRPASEYLKLTLDFKPQTPTRPRNRLADWLEFWQLRNDTGSLEGLPRFQCGDISARLELDTEQLTPADLRLVPDSPGKGAGPGGKDLGADVDLVGPGAAYERWQKTPEYQEWRKAIEKLLTAPGP